MRSAPRWLIAPALVALLSGCDSPPSPAPSGDTTASPLVSSTPSPTSPGGLSPVPSTLVDAPGPAPAPSAEAAPEVIAAQHVLVAYKGAKGAKPAIKRSKAEAKKRAEEALAKAKKGDDFSELVKTYSDEPGAAERLGNLGKFKHEAMVKPFADAAFALKVGEISEPVETEFGFHIIKRNQ